MKTVFVTGTDTGVGKTLFSAWLCMQWQADYWKPIQSGLDDETDTELVTRLASCRCLPERHRLTQPLSPHQSAQLDGVSIQLDDFVWPPLHEQQTQPHTKSHRWVVEGAGGCMVPINWTHCMSDLMLHLGLPALVVARSGLGTINHTCLTLEHLKNKGVPVLGVVLNGPSNLANKKAIEHFSGVKVLAELPWLEDTSSANLKQIAMPVALREALESL
ncbi:MAG: dethiobiotin synthase [Limnobacter sp.]|nr:dethiobiotin synthase [Limnobacter sp.]